MSFVSREAPQGGRAVVVGAGIGGLTAASALSRCFEQVVVLERDVLPSGPAPRPGVPQGRHVHGLLAGGLEALKQLLAGFEEALVAAGAVRFRLGLDAWVEQVGFDPFPRRDLGRWGYSMSRPLLEHVIRQCVLADDRIRIHAGVNVRELLATPDGRGVRGVRLQRPGAGAESLGADLVVDASGRAALTLDFLQRHGFGEPEESAVEVDVRYTCGVFALAPSAARDWKVLATRPDPRVSGRRAIMYPLEGGNHWLLGLGGVNGDAAPPDLEGFIAYARSLRTPTVFNLLRQASLQGSLHRFAFPKSFRRHFERMAGFPDALVPMGDAICRINPAFGQGMSIAAREAVLLGDVASACAGSPGAMAGVGRRFLARLDEVLADPWAVAMQDYVYPHLADRRPEGVEGMLQRQRALNRLAAEDAGVHALMTDIGHLLRSSSVLLEPPIVDRLAGAMQA